jgi:hypothetical protein
MPPGFHIAEEEGLISIQVSHAVDVPALHNLVSGLLESDGYDPALPLLVDLRGMRLELAKDAMGPFNQFIVSRFKGREGSIAVIIDGDMSQKLAAAIFWLACAVGHTEVFDDYEHALKWLIRREFADADTTRERVSAARSG